MTTIYADERIPKRFSEKSEEVKEYVQLMTYRRLSTDEYKGLIRALCSVEMLTAQQISEYIDRHREYTRFQFLAPMVRAGELTVKADSRGLFHYRATR